MERLVALSTQLVPNGVSESYQPGKVLRVLITGAAGQIAYSLIGMVCAGNTFGPNQRVILHLLDIAPMEEKLKGVAMEIEDCAYPLVEKVVVTSKEEVAFKDVDVAMLVGAMPRQPGMERKDLLLKNAQIFKSQGKALDSFASKNVKVVVVGNPANTNALIAQTYAPSIPKQNFTALTRLDQNRAETQIALKLNVPVCCVENISIWGNHSATQYPNIFHGTIKDYPSKGFVVPAHSAVNDPQWVEKTFIPAVQQRGAAVLNARKSSSAMSAAKAISDHVRDWLLGTKPGKSVSMGVTSDGSYGIPTGLIFSFPVTCSNGSYSIVSGLKINEFSRKYLDTTTKELLEEKSSAGL